MKQREITIESSHHVVADESGLGIVNGESYNLMVTLGTKVFRTMSYYGDKTEQEKARAASQEDVKTEVEIEH